ncbi:hypothetical protein IMZ48_07135, partial [Candidatus Bathyarchaeota archaeon]|nr:hypothetical protein [Candidatus Bathyarchaeota archaeon]
MEHAWLDSLSVDWVSQPRSDDSIAQLSRTQQSDENHRPSPSNTKPKGFGSRIPRPIGASSMVDDSVNVLAERSLSSINTAPRRDQPEDSEDFSRSQHDSIRPLSRTASGATVNSVIHNTVHQRPPSASPSKGKGFTPEWKRRLVYGNVAYGDQRDLFCSAAADGLEGIFKPPPPDVAGDTEDPFLEGDSNHNETTLPSSPPVY